MISHNWIIVYTNMRRGRKKRKKIIALLFEAFYGETFESVRVLI